MGKTRTDALAKLKSTTSGQTQEVFKGNYLNHFEVSLRRINPWLSHCDSSSNIKKPGSSIEHLNSTYDYFLIISI